MKCARRNVLHSHLESRHSYLRANRPTDISGRGTMTTQRLADAKSKSTPDCYEIVVLLHQIVKEFLTVH